MFSLWIIETLDHKNVTFWCLRSVFRPVFCQPEKILKALERMLSLLLELVSEFPGLILNRLWILLFGLNYGIVSCGSETVCNSFILVTDSFSEVAFSFWVFAADGLGASLRHEKKSIVLIQANSSHLLGFCVWGWWRGMWGEGKRREDNRERWTQGERKRRTEGERNESPHSGIPLASFTFFNLYLPGWNFLQSRLGYLTTGLVLSPHYRFPNFSRVFWCLFLAF